MWKVHDKEKMYKIVVRLCTLTKISSEIGLLFINCAFLEKRFGLMTYIRFWINHWIFLICYFILWNSEQNKVSSLEILQNCVTPLGNETKFFVIFPRLSLKILLISYLTQGNSTCYFFNIPGKSKSWNTQFCDFAWRDKLLIIILSKNVLYSSFFSENKY